MAASMLTVIEGTRTIGRRASRIRCLRRASRQPSLSARAAAAAAIFAGAAAGKDANQIHRAYSAMREWLANDGPMPDWPGLDAIAAAQAYPGRHGAILLAWQAASEALSTR